MTQRLLGLDQRLFAHDFVGYVWFRCRRVVGGFRFVLEASSELGSAQIEIDEILTVTNEAEQAIVGCAQLLVDRLGLLRGPTLIDSEAGWSSVDR